ncbi:hypothetical protein [Ramlibacter humi]|nr:hypothetical protein [Ramlibacter humi]
MSEDLIHATRLPPRFARWLQAGIVAAVCIATLGAAFATLGGAA